jgi:hypothetical protein
MNSEHWLDQFKICIITKHDDSEIANYISWFDGLDSLQIYFIFARFCKFQKLFEEKGERIAIEGSKGADVNEGKF